MCKDIIKGYRMTDIELRYESERAFLEVADAFLNKIDCTRFRFTKDKIKQMFEDGRCIRYDSICSDERCV